MMGDATLTLSPFLSLSLMGGPVRGTQSHAGDG